MSKCDYCIEWEYFEGYQTGEGCFCMQRTEKLPENEDCAFYVDKPKHNDGVLATYEAVKHFQDMKT